MSSSQPASVGFSTVNNSSVGGPGTLLEAAADFDRFLFIFFSEVFPEFAHLKLHIAGESFGGKYVPTFVKYIAERQKMKAHQALQNDIESIILIDAVIDGITSGVGGHYGHFCGRDSDGKLFANGFNETACRALEIDTPACERLQRNCIDSYDINICGYATTFCDETLGKWLESEIVPGGRDPYDDRNKCGSNPPLCSDFVQGALETYLNLPRVQLALGFHNLNFSAINFDLNKRFDDTHNTNIPTTREVSYILDETETSVLVLNGNNDIIV